MYSACTLRAGILVQWLTSIKVLGVVQVGVKDEFSEDEWFLLSSTPAMIGAAMSGAAPSGVIGTIKEMTASMRASVQGLSDYPESELISALLEKAANWDEAKDKMNDYREKAKTRLDAAAIKSREELQAHVLAECAAAAKLVDAKCSTIEAKNYKEWAVKIANKVAVAAKEGGILGFGGERLSAEESELIAKIETALGAPSGHLVA